MRKWLLALAALLLSAGAAQAQTDALNGFCDQGGRHATVQGLNATNFQQGNIPSCTVTVFLTGTTTKATIFKDTLNTPLSNPFTAAVLGSTAPGQWVFYAATGVGYDVVMSGGIAPNTYATPVTLTDLKVGSGSSGSGCLVSGTASFILLDNGHGGCVDANGANIGVQAIDNSAAGMAFAEAGSGGFEVTTSFTGSGLGQTYQDFGTGGMTWIEHGTGGMNWNAGSGGFSLTGGSDGFPGLINGTGLVLHSGGLTPTLDDMQIASQTRHIQIRGGTVSLTDGYSALDTTALLSNDAFNIAIPRFSGTWMLYNGALTANDCVQVNATGNGFIDSGAGCGGGGGGGAAFNAITSGSNTTATMVVGTGASLAPSGTGTIAATSVGGITVTGTPSTGQILTATSSSAANWQASSAGSAFSALTSGTNTAAAMLVGTGASLGVTGSGTIAATTSVALATLPAPCGMGQYTTGIDTQGNAICAALPTQPASQYIAPQAMSGCGIEYVAGLQYTVGACTYSINGVIYHSPLTNITLAAADPTNPRIDVIFVDTTQVVQQIAGTPAVSPQQPTTDPSTQLELTFVLVPAASTIPGNTTLVDIYLEGVEWTGAKGGTNGSRVNLTSTSNPYSGTHDTEFGVGGTVAATTFAGYTVPSAGTVNLANYNTLTFYMRNKAAWATTNSITVQWFNGATQKGTGVVISNGAFGWNATTNTTTYQQISIPTSLFGIAGVPVTSVRFTVSGTGAALTGFYLDQITLQGGAGGPSLPATLMNFKGPWSSTATYNPNDTVTSGGVGYVALATNTNVAVTTAATWAPLAPTGGGTLTTFAAPTGSWPSWLVPAVTNPSGPTASLAVTANSIPYTALAGIGANMILGSIAATTPVALPIPNCNTVGSSAIIWTSGVGWGCNTISGGGGGGNTTSTSLTNNHLPKANGVNSIIDSGAVDTGSSLSYTGSGTVNSFSLTEGTADTPVAGQEIINSIASTHTMNLSSNGGSFSPICTAANGQCTGAGASVESFGAVGYTTLAAAIVGTDSTSSIQACLNSLATTGGQCTLKGLFYRVTSALSITWSGVGIRGVSPDVTNSTFISAANRSVIVSTSASADIIDVFGASTSTNILGNRLEFFSVERSIIPTGTAAGIYVNHNAGVVLYSVVSQDSIYAFHLHDTHSLAAGINQCLAQFGYNGVTETTGSLYGYYLDSADGVANPSIQMTNNTAVSNLSGGPTTYGVYIHGSHINDLWSQNFNTANVGYGIYVDYTGSGGTDEEADLHFYGSILDQSTISGIFINNVSFAGAAWPSIEINGGWAVASSPSGNDIDIENSKGVAVSGMQVGGGPAIGIYANGSSNINISHNNLFNFSGKGIVLNTTTNSVVSGNTLVGVSGATDHIQLTSTSVNNVVANNAMSGTGTVGIATDTTSSKNTGFPTNNISSSLTAAFNDTGTNPEIKETQNDGTTPLSNCPGFYCLITHDAFGEGYVVTAKNTLGAATVTFLNDLGNQSGIYYGGSTNGTTAYRNNLWMYNLNGDVNVRASGNVNLLPGTGGTPTPTIAVSTTQMTSQVPISAPSYIGLPLYLNWVFNSGAAATDASPRFLASHTGTIATCYALTTASDGSTDLTFNIFDNGSSIFSGGAQTITHGTSAGTLTTLGSLGTTSITNNDKFSINITSGTSSWIFTVSCK